MLNSADEYSVICHRCKRAFPVSDSELPSDISRLSIQELIDILQWQCAGCTRILEREEDRGQSQGRLEA